MLKTEINSMVPYLSFPTINDLEFQFDVKEKKTVCLTNHQR